MSELKAYRLSKIASEFNVGITTIVDFLKKKGHNIDAKPNEKIASDLYALLSKEFSSDISAKKDAERVNLRGNKKGSAEISKYDEHKYIDDEEEHKPPILIRDTSLGIKTPLFSSPRDLGFKVIGKIELEEKPKRKDRKSRKKQQQKEANKQQPQQQQQQQPKDGRQQQQSKDTRPQQQPKDAKQQQQPKDGKQQPKDARQQQQPKDG